MSYPIIAGTSTSMETNGVTSHTVSLPANIVSGDLLIVLFCGRDVSSATINFPAGWNIIKTGLNGSSEIFKSAYRVADGSEGSTITVTTGSTGRSAHISYRITDYTSTPEGEVNSSINPPSLTPSWGTKDSLWIAVARLSAHGGTPAAPANYSDLQDVNPARDTRGFSAVRNLNASSEDPGAFGGTAFGSVIGCTIGVQGIGEEEPEGIKIQMMI